MKACLLLIFLAILYSTLVDSVLVGNRIVSVFHNVQQQNLPALTSYVLSGQICSVSLRHAEAMQAAKDLITHVRNSIETDCGINCCAPATDGNEANSKMDNDQFVIGVSSVVSEYQVIIIRRLLSLIAMSGAVTWPMC